MRDLSTLLEQADADAREREAGREMAKSMLSILMTDCRWYKRKELMELLHLKDSRQLSLGREYSDGMIIYGQKGFRASVCATRDELQQCANTVRSQVRAMQLYCISVEQFLHKGLTQEAKA